MKILLATIILIFLFIPFFSHATLEACTSTTKTSTSLCNPFAGNVGTIDGAMGYIATTFGILAGGFTVIMLTFSGFRMIMSQGNVEEVTKAKSAFQWTLLGFGLILLAFVLVSAIADYIGVNPDIPIDATVQNPISSANFGILVDRMVTGLLGVVGTLSLLMIIFSGLRYVTAGGNEEQATQAKEGLKWAVIGLIVVALAYILVVATAQFLGANVTGS